MQKDRTKLPYRINCEGYFLSNDGKVLAQDTGLGYIEFPGGGVDGDIASSMLREVLEETGAQIIKLREIAVIRFDWAHDWAKTEKQKDRYQKFRGEEMHLFVGEIVELGKAIGDPEHGDSGWQGDKLMEINNTISLIESFKPFPPTMTEYHEKQLWVLKNLSALL